MSTKVSQLTFRLVMIGAPGSGKGTISSRLCDRYRLKHVCSGDLLRNAIQKGNDDGKLAKYYIEQGQLVPTELVTRLTFGEINRTDRWLLDGYPRNLDQAHILHDHVELQAVIWLNVPEDEIVRRIKGRWIHVPSGRVYHTEYKPPKVAGLDDVTGEELVQRADDREEAVRHRLQQYDQLTRPLIDFFEQKQLLATFEGTESSVIYPQVSKYLEQRFPVETDL